MVALALIVNDVDVDAFDPADAEFQPTDGRVELEYATLSLQPEWEDMVSPAAYVGVDAPSTSPMYQAAVYALPAKKLSRRLFFPTVTTKFSIGSAHLMFPSASKQVTS